VILEVVEELAGDLERTSSDRDGRDTVPADLRLARRTSRMLFETVLSRNAPPDAPMPVKSKRSTAYPASARPPAMRVVVWRSFEQVKQ
jgi:hypothetical protein